MTANPHTHAPLGGLRSASLNEDASTSIDLGPLVSDVETSDANLSYTIVAAPAHGSLSGSGQSRTYAPNANYNGTDSFSYYVTDRGDPDNCGAPSASCDAVKSSATKTVSITVNPVNDAPVLDASGSPSLNAIDEDDSSSAGTKISDLIASGGAGYISDADSGALQGLAITAANTSNGSWQYTTDGTTWNALGAVSNTQARLLAADANTKVRFQPAANFNGT